MLYTKPQPGSKLRCINAADYDFMTVDKIYEVISAESNGFCYIDDDGDQLFYNFDSIDDIKFELVEKDSTTDIKIGDWVKLKEWESFLEVKEVNGFGDKILLIEEGVTSWYDISLGFVKQGEDIMTEKQEDQKQDDFQVGDVVWCAMYGKGKVTQISRADSYPIRVDYVGGDYNYYSYDGKFQVNGQRTLFFSEPKIEAAVIRPFVPTLVGKKVVVESQSLGMLMACTVTGETHDMVNVIDESGDDYRWQKEDVSAIYEVSSENLLKK